MSSTPPTGITLLQSLHIGDTVTLTGVIDNIGSNGWQNYPITLKNIDTTSIVVSKKALHFGASAICRSSNAPSGVIGRVVLITAIEIERNIADIKFIDDDTCRYALPLDWFDYATKEEADEAVKQRAKKKQEEKDKWFEEEAKTLSDDVLCKRAQTLLALIGKKK